MENEEKAIVKVDVVPKFEISVSEAGERLKELNTFIESQMIKGSDYGVIPGIPKPSLFKSGAEKLENIYGFYHEFEELDKPTDEREYIFYRYKCKVFHKGTGIKQSECIGSANSEEKSHWKENPMKSLNTIDKMAQKRAFVGAILSAVRVSSRFTQDVEDIKVNPKTVDSTASKTCAKCPNSITEKVAAYSMAKYNRELCMDCQKEEPVV